MNEAIFVFALVLAVVGSVAAVLITWFSRSALLRLQADWRDWHLKLHAEVKRLEGAVERTTNSKLAAEVDALRGAVDVMRNANRKEFGSLWARVGRGPRASAFFDGMTGVPLEGDDEVNAMLALQSAKPAGPTNGAV